MNPGQIANVHIAKSQLKLNDQEYRLILRNVAGVESSKDLTNQSLEKLMAFFEERGFRQKDQAEDYWRRKYHAQGQFCGERMAHLIHELSQQVKYPLDSLVAKASKGRTARVEELNPAQANNLVEMLKSMANRHEGTQPRRHEVRLKKSQPSRRGQSRALSRQRRHALFPRHRDLPPILPQRGPALPLPAHRRHRIDHAPLERRRPSRAPRISQKAGREDQRMSRTSPRPPRSFKPRRCLRLLGMHNGSSHPDPAIGGGCNL